MDVHMHLQVRCETHNRIVVRMTAGDCLCARPGILDPNARSLTDPLLNFRATFFRKCGVNGGATGKAGFVPLHDLEDLSLERIRIKWFFQCAADLLRDGVFNPHAIDKKLIAFVLFNWVRPKKTMKVVVPNSVADQFIPGWQPVLGWIDREFARLHRLLPAHDGTVSLHDGLEITQ